MQIVAALTRGRHMEKNSICCIFSCARNVMTPIRAFLLPSFGQALAASRACLLVAGRRLASWLLIVILFLFSELATEGVRALFIFRGRLIHFGLGGYHADASKNGRLIDSGDRGHLADV